MESENVYAASQASNPKSPSEPKKKGPTVFWVAVAVAAFFVLVGMMLPPVSTPPHVARRAECLNRCRQISLAMLNYESKHLHFPPAYIADENGKPMHSWRVLILPYLEQQELFDRYDMDEPWDGPNNSKLHDEIVNVYRCPSSSSEEHYTDYVLITGEGTAFVKDQTIGFGDISDGSSNTIVLTEIADSQIHWMQPQDISPEQFLGIESSGKSTTNHREVRNVALFDGSTHALSVDTDPKELQKLITIAGGEVVDVTDL